nr:uncharacterized protein LOC124224006 [Neodiprion pinetum]
MLALFNTEEEIEELLNNSTSSLSSIPKEKTIAETHESIKRSHEVAFQGLEKQAKRMKLASDAKFKPLERGMFVLLPVPDVDKSKADSKNLIGVIMEVTEDGFYKIETQSGIISGLFSRNQIAPATAEFLQKDVPQRTLVQCAQFTARNVHCAHCTE